MLKTRANHFIFVILISSSLFFDGNKFGVDARFFSENNGYQPLEKIQDKNEQYQPKEVEQLKDLSDNRPLTDDEIAYYDYIIQRENEKQNNQELSQILDELYAQELASEQQKAAQELEQAQNQEKFIKAEVPTEDFQQELNTVNNEEFVNTENNNNNAEVEPKNLPESAPKMPTAQKKGQSEFVEFVEPPQSKVLKSVDSMDKRVPTEQLYNSPNRGIHLLSTSGNIMFIAVVAMCCVVSVFGVVGGVYYYNNRKNPVNDFDDFTRYSPAGPGKKLASLRTNGVRMDENGDDSLAYKAQLHHYQQSKQKVIGAEEGTLSGATSPAGSPHSIHHNENSEDEAEDLEEHNYSVYECPGLAPTGDIEVNNPNFGHGH